MKTILFGVLLAAGLHAQPPATATDRVRAGHVELVLSLPGGREIDFERTLAAEGETLIPLAPR